MRKCLFFIILLMGMCLANESIIIENRLPKEFFGRWFNMETSNKEDRMDFLNDGQFYYSYGNFVAPGIWTAFKEDSLYYCFYFNQYVDNGNGGIELRLLRAEYIGSYEISGNMLHFRVRNMYTGSIKNYHYRTKERFRLYGNY